MSMHGENQVRNLFVVNTSTNTTIPTVRAGANLNGAVTQSDGTAAADNEDFVLAVKNNRGEMSLSDIIAPSRVKSAKFVDNVARVLSSTTISSITAEANKLYQVRVVIKGYGSLSTENEYIKEAFYKSKTGDDAENIVDGLIKSLARNFSREQPQQPGTFTYTLANASTVELPLNYGFAFSKTGTGASAALVITEKIDWLTKSYVTGKKTRLSQDFTVDAYFPTEPTTVKVLGNEGQLTGYHARNLEEYFLGNRGDSFRGAGYPHNFEQTYDTVLANDYYGIEIEYYDEGRDDPMKSKKQLTILVDATAITAVNALMAQLTTALTTRGIAFTPLV